MRSEILAESNRVTGAAKARLDAMPYRYVVAYWCEVDGPASKGECFGDTQVGLATPLTGATTVGVAADGQLVGVDKCAGQKVDPRMREIFEHIFQIVRPPEGGRATPHTIRVTGIQSLS